MLTPVTSKILCEPSNNCWTCFYTENFAELCTIDIDLSNLPLSPLSKRFGSRRYYRLDYDIVLFWGQTELKALIAWKENVRFPSITFAYLHRILSCRVLSGGAQRKLCISQIWWTMPTRTRNSSLAFPRLMGIQNILFSSTDSGSQFLQVHPLSEGKYISIIHSKPLSCEDLIYCLAEVAWNGVRSFKYLHPKQVISPIK